MKSKWYGFALVLITLASCQSARQEDDANAQDTSSAEGDIQNQLTREQKTEGWKLLFNGQNTEGWRIYKGKENNSWEVVDGTLHCKPFDVATKRSDIMTTEQFSDFELTFDWKVSPQANSGVIFRVTEEFEEAYLSGPEYQVLDDEGYPGDVKDVQLTGSNYDMHPAPAGKPLRPVGEWNSSRIMVKGNHVEHWLNNSKLIEYELSSEDWKKLKEGSKWKDAAGYGMSKTGYIDFQDHGNEVWYRNIKIRNL